MKGVFPMYNGGHGIARPPRRGMVGGLAGLIGFAT